MKADLDRLMAARGLDAIVVECADTYSAARDYLTHGAAITQGKIVKKQGAAPILIVNAMETEEAKKSGLAVYSYYDVGWAELLKAADGNRDKASIGFWGNCLAQAGVHGGKVGIYGVGSLNGIIATLDKLREAYPQYTLVGEGGMTVFDEAYLTKDGDELARLRSIGEKTAAVLQATWDYIAAHRADGETVVNDDGAPLTIGDVKRFVRRALLDHDLEDTDMIFAQGRDGGFPHSRGEAHEALQLGKAIVFDLFPREIGGGYFHDCTRTWCIGYAPPEVQAAYEQVVEAFDLSVEIIRPNMEAKAVQMTVQDYFESHGHPTLKSDAKTTVGYTHGLGHGIGLNIHERPQMSHMSTDTLQIGNVFTIEPGLYYPEQGFGVRVEESFYLGEGGELVSLTPFQRDLVLPLRG
jgi:Xaa-Pro aminopeptidase